MSNITRLTLAIVTSVGAVCVAGGVPGQANAEPKDAKLVKDINPGPDDSNSGFMTAVGDTLFFIATDPVHGQELWSTKGNEGRTRLVKDINPDPNPFADPPGLLTAVGDTLAFTAFEPITGRELWKTIPPKITPPRGKGR